MDKFCVARLSHLRGCLAAHLKALEKRLMTPFGGNEMIVLLLDDAKLRCVSLDDTRIKAPLGNLKLRALLTNY